MRGSVGPIATGRPISWCVISYIRKFPRLTMITIATEKVGFVRQLLDH